MGLQSYNLKTFGCSFTYGHGLPDCIQEDMMTHGFSPSNMAWPNHLKGICGFKKLYNLSKPGISNKTILKRIVEHDYTEKDIVVILWSNFDRQTFWKDPKTKLHIVPLRPDMSHNLDLAWYEYHGAANEKEYLEILDQYFGTFHYDFDVCFNNVSIINYAHAYLKSKNVRSYHLHANHSIPKEHKKYFNKMMINDIRLKTFDWKTDFFIDDALDQPHPHPGMKSHHLLATNIYRWFFE